MKKWIALIISISLAMSLSACAELERDIRTLLKGAQTNHETYKFDNCTLVLCDRANIMTDEEEDKLIEVLTPYCESVHCNVLIMSTNAQSMSATTQNGGYVDALLPNDSDDTLAIIIDVAHHEYYINTNGVVHETLEKSGGIDEAFRRASNHVNDEEYYEAFKQMAISCMEDLD
jgi:hypothetical protein